MQHIVSIMNVDTVGMHCSLDSMAAYNIQMVMCEQRA